MSLNGERSLENPQNWQSELLNSYSSLDDLVRAKLLPLDLASRLKSVERDYRIRLPRYYASLIDPTDRDCPIRKQAIPMLEESDPELPDWAQKWSHEVYGRAVPWTLDAIGDLEKLAAPRLTHRYENRAILHLSSLCALYCRFCFRKGHLNSADRALYDGSLEPPLEYLSAHPEIREVILTGGDPLSLGDANLSRLFDRLEAITQIKVVRIHSRMPVTLPSRLTPELFKIFEARPFQVHLVSHFNHPRELTKDALEKLILFGQGSIKLFNQSVLLKGVNDSLQTLEKLFQTLYEHGVVPFYLHHPDWTPGTFHFRLPIARGRELIGELAGRLSGPAMPHYVLDLPNGHGKLPLMSTRLEQLEAREESGISGALYRVKTSSTRAPQGSVQYAEFWPTT